MIYTGVIDLSDGRRLEHLMLCNFVTWLCGWFDRKPFGRQAFDMPWSFGQHTIGGHKDVDSGVAWWQWGGIHRGQHLAEGGGQFIAVLTGCFMSCDRQLHS